MSKTVTVIIPSYNRAKFLPKTILTYLQKDVEEIIIVDDCSTDDTEKVVRELKKNHPIIKYLKQPQNLKQTAAKNRALAENITTPWVYFGDDDSLLFPGTIHYLLETAINKNADIVGACALYAGNEKDLDDLSSFQRKVEKIQSIHELGNICYPETLNFSKKADIPLRVPVCQACALVRTSVAQATLYDTSYVGNAYREETDFFLRATEHGARIYYDSRGAQINLPMITIGRKPTIYSRLRFHYYDIRNTCLMLYRHNWYLREKFGYKYNKYIMCLGYIYRKMFRLLKNR